MSQSLCHTRNGLLLNLFLSGRFIVNLAFDYCPQTLILNQDVRHSATVPGMRLMLSGMEMPAWPSRSRASMTFKTSSRNSYQPWSAFELNCNRRFAPPSHLPQHLHKPPENVFIQLRPDQLLHDPPRRVAAVSIAIDPAGDQSVVDVTGCDVPRAGVTHDKFKPPLQPPFCTVLRPQRIEVSSKRSCTRRADVLYSASAFLTGSISELARRCLRLTARYRFRYRRSSER